MIRLASTGDLPEILAIYAPYVRNTTYSFEYEVPSEAAFAARFEQITAQFPWLVWEEDGTILGYAYASAPFERAAFGWCAEDSLYLRPEARGRRIGTRLLTALEAILRLQGYCRVYAIITSENLASLDFHRKNGYQFTAQMPDCGFKFGRRLGITWMDKSLNSVDFPNSNPVSWSELVNNAQTFSDILGILSLF